MASQPAQQAQVTQLALLLANASGNKELPLKIWQTYIATGKKESDLALSMAQVSLQLGLPKQAQTILESALQKQPGSVAVNKALVALQIATGQYEQGMDRLATVIAADANQSIEVGRILRQISAAAGPDFHRQFAQKHSSDTSPQSAPSHYLAGVLAGVRGDQALAAKQYEQALQSDHGFLLTYDSMLTMYLEQRQMADAQKLLDRAGKLD